MGHDLPDLVSANVPHPFERAVPVMGKNVLRMPWKPVSTIPASMVTLDDDDSLQCDNCMFIISGGDGLTIYAVHIAAGVERHFCSPCHLGYYVVRTHALEHNPFMAMVGPTSTLWCCRCACHPPQTTCTCGADNCRVESCERCLASFGRSELCADLGNLGLVQPVRYGAPATLYYHISGPHTPRQVFADHCGDGLTAAHAVHAVRHEVK